MERTVCTLQATGAHTALEREIDELSHVEEALIEAAIARGEISPSVAVGATASGSRRTDRGAWSRAPQ